MNKRSILSIVFILAIALLTYKVVKQESIPIVESEPVQSRLVEIEDLPPVEPKPTQPEEVPADIPGVKVLEAEESVLFIFETPGKYGFGFSGLTQKDEKIFQYYISVEIPGQNETWQPYAFEGWEDLTKKAERPEFAVEEKRVIITIHKKWFDHYEVQPDEPSRPHTVVIVPNHDDTLDQPDVVHLMPLDQRTATSIRTLSRSFNL